MPNLTPANAKALAVSYHAYLSRPAEDYNGRWVWGRSLQKAQEATGIEMLPADFLARGVDEADAELRAIDAEKALPVQMGTKRTLSYMVWWPAFNAELRARDLKDAGFATARFHYDDGRTAIEAAQYEAYTVEAVA